MLEVFKEFFMFAKKRKKLILFPLVVMLIVLGTLLVLAQSTIIAPFIYALF